MVAREHATAAARQAAEAKVHAEQASANKSAGLTGAGRYQKAAAAATAATAAKERAEEAEAEARLTPTPTPTLTLALTPTL